MPSVQLITFKLVNKYHKLELKNYLFSKFNLDLKGYIGCNSTHTQPK